MHEQLVLEVSLFITLIILVCTGFVFLNNKNDGVLQRVLKLTSALLGCFFLMSGLAKFFEPFHNQFLQQIVYSGLAYPAAVNFVRHYGELLAGGLFIGFLCCERRVSEVVGNYILFVASGVATLVLSIDVYIHVVPQVPAELLPLHCKPPLLPLSVLSLVMINIFVYVNTRVMLLNQSSISAST